MTVLSQDSSIFVPGREFTQVDFLIALFSSGLENRSLELLATNLRHTIAVGAILIGLLIILRDAGSRSTLRVGGVSYCVAVGIGSAIVGWQLIAGTLTADSLRLSNRFAGLFFGLIAIFEGGRGVMTWITTQQRGTLQDEPKFAPTRAYMLAVTAVGGGIVGVILAAISPSYLSTSASLSSQTTGTTLRFLMEYNLGLATLAVALGVVTYALISVLESVAKPNHSSMEHGAAFGLLCTGIALLILSVLS